MEHLNLNWLLYYLYINLFILVRHHEIPSIPFILRCLLSQLHEICRLLRYSGVDLENVYYLRDCVGSIQFIIMFPFASQKRLTSYIKTHSRFSVLLLVGDHDQRFTGAQRGRAVREARLIWIMERYNIHAELHLVLGLQTVSVVLEYSSRSSINFKYSTHETLHLTHSLPPLAESFVCSRIPFL